MKKKTQKKKVTKKLDVHTNTDVKRYIGAIAEHFGGQVSAVAEQFGSLHEKLDVHTSEFERVNKKLDVHTEMIGGIMEDVAIIKSDVEILKAGLRIKVDYKDFEALERRVRLVETKMRR